MKGILQSIGGFFADKVRRVLPDSFVFAVVLSALTFILALSLTDTSAVELMDFWVKGLYSSQILTFGMFMIMVLTFGHTVGDSAPVRRFFEGVSERVKGPTTVYLIIVITSLTLNLINWALAPVTALFTVELCKRVKGVDYRLACAALYSGMLIWHGGLSSSAALMLASETTAQGFIDEGLINEVIPVTKTLLHPLNIVLILVTFIALPLLLLALRPPYEQKFDAALQHEVAFSEVGLEDEEPQGEHLADRLNRARWVNWLIAGAGLVGVYFIMKSDGFNLSSLSLLMFSLALIMQGSPIRFVQVMKEAIGGSSDIVIQFPLFGGIMNIFILSGLAPLFAEALLQLGSGETLPWLAFLCSSTINLFIPSGGGEWLVLGPPLLEAANASGADVGKTIIAFAYGDSLTNLMNPFWTLTFLPIMGILMRIETRDFMGYTVFLCGAFFLLESLLILLI